MSARIKTFDFRESAGAFTVTALSAGFGVILIGASEAMANGIAASSVGELNAVRTVLMTVSWVFLGLSLFVGGIVTSNTFGTIIAGRAQKLALFRLLGASSKSLRAASVRDGLSVAVSGAVVGGAIGMLLTQASIAAGKQWWGFSEAIHASWFSVAALAPIVAAACVTILAAWTGSRSVLSITPVEAFGNAQAALETRESSVPPSKSGTALTCFIIGALLLALGVLLGYRNPIGVLIAFPGGVLTFIAFMLKGDVLLPPLLSLGSRMGHTAPALLAARNTARNPRRSSRTTMGIVIGVGMISMFTVVGATYASVIDNGLGDEEIGTELLVPALVILLLVGFSALLAVIGLLNNSSLSAIQRRKEISLLRALGLTKPQVRRMALLEGLRTSGVAAAVGLALGIFYGWAGATSSIGATMSELGIMGPSVPWQLIVGVVAGAIVVTLLSAAVTMSKLASARPMEALAEG